MEDDPKARLAVLAERGYELFDFDMWDGWIILEESSAERIIRDYLVPWCVPRLTRARTIAANGVSRAEPVFDDFNRLFVFTHLEEQYRNRSCVILDGDEPGMRVVEQLRTKYGAKRELLIEVVAWCDAEPETAKSEFLRSASEVLGVLNEVDEMLFGGGGRA